MFPEANHLRRWISTSEGVERGTSAEDVATEVLRLHVPPRPATGRFAFIAIGQAKPRFSAKEAEERLEADGLG